MKTSNSNLFNLVSILFIPIILVFSIINISLSLETVANITILIAFICYVIAFIIQIILFILFQNSTKKVKEELASLDKFDENEIESIYSLILALNKYDFFTYTRLSLSMFSFLSPTALTNIR